MESIPGLVGLAEALAQLVNDGLRDRREAHLCVADVQIEGAATAQAAVAQGGFVDDLADDFVGAAIIGFGTGGLAAQGQRAVVLQEVEQLEVARFGVAEFRGGPGGPKPFALTLEEHGQFESDFVIGGYGQGTGRGRSGLAKVIMGRR